MNKAVKYILCFLLGASLSFIIIFIYRNSNKIDRLYYYPQYMNVKTNDLIEDNYVHVDIKASYKDFSASSSSNNTTKSYSNIFSSFSEFENSVDEKDRSVVEYFKEKLISVTSNSSSSSFKDNAKEVFTTTVDFLFYGGTIKGVTFKELTTKGKLEVVKLALKMQDIIEKYFPGLLDNLSTKYNVAKEKLVSMYENVTNEYCMENPDNCEYAKMDYENMQDSMQFTFDIVKGAGDLISSKTSNWYLENFK